MLLHRFQFNKQLQAIHLHYFLMNFTKPCEFHKDLILKESSIKALSHITGKVFRFLQYTGFEPVTHRVWDDCSNHWTNIGNNDWRCAFPWSFVTFGITKYFTPLPLSLSHYSQSKYHNEFANPLINSMASAFDWQSQTKIPFYKKFLFIVVHSSTLRG